MTERTRITQILAYLLGMIFLISGLSKIVNLYEFKNLIKNYKFLPQNATLELIFLLIAVEIIVGIIFFVRRFHGLAATASAVLLIMFIIFSIYARSYNIKIDCGCISFIHLQMGGIMHFIQNIALLIMSLGIILLRDSRKNIGIKGKKNTFFSLLIMLLLLPVPAFSNITSRKKPLSFKDIFSFDEETIIKGDDINPIFSCYNIHISEDKIFIPDYLGHAIYIYKKNGELLKKIGGEISDNPGHFNMPYGIVIDKNKFLYVNDRGNNRIQIFDPSLKFHGEFSVKGPVETIILSLRGNIILVNVVPTFPGKGGLCLIKEVNCDGKSINAFYSPPKKRYAMYSWAVASDEKDRIYISNILENEISIFNSNRRLWKNVALSSPTILPIGNKLKSNPKSFSELWDNRKILDLPGFTKISRIYAQDEHIFVLFKMRKNEKENYFYLLDVFDMEGKAVICGIETPGELCCITDKFYFMSFNSQKEYGSVKITGARLRYDTLIKR